MIKNILTRIVQLSMLVLIIWLIFFSDYWDSVLGYIASFIGIIIGLIILGSVIFFLYAVTKKWLTEGLDESEKDVAVLILAVIVYGAIFYALYYYISPYFDDIESGLIYLMKIIVGAFVLAMPFVMGFSKILTLNIKQENKSTLYTLIIALISSITLEFFYGDSIMKWLGNNWYYLVGGFFVIVIIFVLIEIKKKPTPN